MRLQNVLLKQSAEDDVQYAVFCVRPVNIYHLFFFSKGNKKDKLKSNKNGYCGRMRKGVGQEISLSVPFYSFIS